MRLAGSCWLSSSSSTIEPWTVWKGDIRRPCEAISAACGPARKAPEAAAWGGNAATAETGGEWACWAASCLSTASSLASLQTELLLVAAAPLPGLGWTPGTLVIGRCGTAMPLLWLLLLPLWLAIAGWLSPLVKQACRPAPQPWAC